MAAKVGTPVTTGRIGTGAATMIAVTAATGQARGNGPHTAGMTTHPQAGGSQTAHLVTTAPAAMTDPAVMIGRIAAMTAAVREGGPPVLRGRIVRAAMTGRANRIDMIVPIVATTGRTKKTDMIGQLSGQRDAQTGRKEAAEAGRADAQAPATANSNLRRHAFKSRR